MNSFLEEFRDFTVKNNLNVIRASLKTDDGDTETLEIRQDIRCRNVYSVSKAFTMTAVGILCDRGILSVDERITDIFSGRLPESTDPRFEKETVESALLHRAGFPEAFMDIDVHNTMYYGRDFLAGMFSEPPVYTPGEKEIYTDASYYLLSRIVSEKTGLGLDDFLWNELLADMDFAEMAWSHCPGGYAIGATGMYIHTEDMIKLGVLYRDGGLFGGKRFISKEWVDTVLKKRYCFEWNGNRSIFYKGGMYGQMLLVCPSPASVLAVQSYGVDSSAFVEFTEQYYKI